MQTTILIFSILILALLVVSIGVNLRINTEVLKLMGKGHQIQRFIFKRVSAIEHADMEDQIQNVLFNPSEALGLSGDFKIEIFSDGQCRLLDKKNPDLGFHQVSRHKGIAGLIAALQGEGS